MEPCTDSNHCDWVERGAVTDVRNQGGCGSCWSFAAAANAEANYYIKTGEHHDLSEQQSVDCVTESSYGCNGGHSWAALKYHANVRGYTTENDYPYAGVKGTCDSSKPEIVKPSGNGYQQLPWEDPNALKGALKNGTVVVYLWASDPVFTQYSSGVVTEDCTSNNINHAVLAVGYGVDEETGLDYFLIKNSWGSWWGANGYIKIGIAPGFGICGIHYWYPYQVTF